MRYTCPICGKEIEGELESEKSHFYYEGKFIIYGICSVMSGRHGWNKYLHRSIMGKDFILQLSPIVKLAEKHDNT